MLNNINVDLYGAGPRGSKLELGGVGWCQLHEVDASVVGMGPHTLIRKH